MALVDSTPRETYWDREKRNQKIAAAMALSDRIGRKVTRPALADPTVERDWLMLDDGTKITLLEIIREISRRAGISEGDILGQSRARHITAARQQVMWAARALTKLGTPEIGRRLGDRDHSTVIHGSAQIEATMGMPRHFEVPRGQAIAFVRLGPEHAGGHLPGRKGTSGGKTVSAAST